MDWFVPFSGELKLVHGDHRPRTGEMEKRKEVVGRGFG